MTLASINAQVKLEKKKMSSDEEQETISPPPRKRGRPPKSEKMSPPRKGKKVSDDGMDGVHYACEVCDQVFLHKSNYLRHSERHEAPGGFVCSICQYPFTTEWDRNKHKRDDHSVYRCRICHAEFPMEADYTEHIQTEHEGRDCEYDICPKCGQQFKSASQLKVHVESKCGKEKKYKCNKCNALHVTQASLNTHMMKHVDEKSFQCNQCESSFPNKDQLAVHERMHTDTKPYKCNKCDKAFVRRDNLITHFLTHSGTKPYNCSYCNDRFSCIGNLLKHRRARPDTCGLPQHCITNKTSPRPSVTTKIASSHSDRAERKPFRTKESDISRDVKPVITTKPPARKPAASSTIPPDEKKPHVSNVKTEVKRERKKSESQQKMVVFKVVKSDNEMKADDSNHSAEREDVVEICEVKIEADGSISQREQKVESDIEDDSHEILFESVIDEDGTVHLSTDHKFDIEAEADEEDQAEAEGSDGEEEYQDQDVSLVYEPPPQYDAKGIRRTFTTKPPVITDIRKRGRQRKFRPPKPKSENIIVLDLEAQQREIEEQRSVFEMNVHKLSEDCYRCGHCPMQYVSPFMMGRHLENDHGIVLRELLKTLRYDREFIHERKYACRYCNRLYVNEKALEKHLPLHGPDGRLLHKCTCCPLHFETPDEVRNHQINDHGGYLQCQDCAKVFKKHCLLRKHRELVHEGIAKKVKYHYVCPQCGKSFSSKASVSDHERSQCGKNPIYQCEICEKFFHTASSLKNHYSVHTNELPHSCQYCGKGFRSRGQVKVHERQHTGEKPFKCEFCPKSFGHRETLHTHRSSHTGIKRYMCSGCGQRFACVSNLQCHRRSHRDTCGTVPTVSRVVGPDGYHELPEGYVLPFPKYIITEDGHEVAISD